MRKELNMVLLHTKSLIFVFLINLIFFLLNSYFCLILNVQINNWNRLKMLMSSIIINNLFLENLLFSANRLHCQFIVSRAFNDYYLLLQIEFVLYMQRFCIQCLWLQYKWMHRKYELSQATARWILIHMCMSVYYFSYLTYVYDDCSRLHGMPCRCCCLSICLYFGERKNIRLCVYVCMCVHMCRNMYKHTLSVQHTTVYQKSWNNDEIRVISFKRQP